MCTRFGAIAPTWSTFVAALLGFLTVPSFGEAQMPDHPFQPGTRFPTLALPALEDGRPRSIADFRGQKVILHIFASW